MSRRSARCARLPAPPFDRAALSLTFRAPSPHPRPSLPRSSAATSARLCRALRSISSTRVVTRPAREKGHERGEPAMDPHLVYNLQKSEDPSGEPPPPAPDRPSGSTGDPQHTREEPTAASPVPAPAPAFAEAGTGAEADVPATTRAQRLASRCGVSGDGRVAGCPGTAPPPSRPQRHALAMRPPRKTRLFSSLNYSRAGRCRSSRERGPTHSSIKTGGVKKPSFSSG